MSHIMGFFSSKYILNSFFFLFLFSCYRIESTDCIFRLWFIEHGLCARLTMRMKMTPMKPFKQKCDVYRKSKHKFLLVAKRILEQLSVNKIMFHFEKDKHS